MKNTLKIFLFFLILTAGVLYVDYQNNLLMGNPRITIIDTFAADIHRMIQYPRTKLP